MFFGFIVHVITTAIAHILFIIKYMSYKCICKTLLVFQCNLRISSKIVLHCQFYLGHYSSTSASSCIQCTAGHFCTASTQTPCGTTKYSNAGATSCSDCPAGYKCDSTTTATPTKCLAGTYSGTAAASCTSCDKGHQCPVDGMTAPEACGNGTYAPSAGATACALCPAGRLKLILGDIIFNSAKVYCKLLKFSFILCQKKNKANNSINITFLGQKCTDVTAAASDCVQGEYSPEGSSLCYTCLDGWYSDLAQSTTCTECPAGSKCPNKNTVPTQCGPGEYRYGNQEINSRNLNNEWLKK